jgi:hypothetical protein
MAITVTIAIAASVVAALSASTLPSSAGTAVNSTQAGPRERAALTQQHAAGMSVYLPSTKYGFAIPKTTFR